MEELLLAAKELMRFCRISDEVEWIVAVSISPAQKLRNQAREIEERDAAIRSLRSVITAIEREAASAAS